MVVTQQILWGSLFMAGCLLIEIGLLVWCTLMLRAQRGRWSHFSRALRAGAPVALALLFIIAAHTVQVWIWAGALLAAQAVPDLNTALYFSLASYTTLGYGDIILGEELRIFGAFSAVAGLLAFGLSTAYLVALMTRLFETHMLGD
ncbi:Ion channel [Cribrihabitans marinus]|uniref:Ion channel n=1 Tax=Cribrihabitans marinus TaxID=1227549 RepID=A0A1H6WIL7_9RHOB|nr:ion channel [Cribrihabitans marinus]GGH24095.1 hypothetical protein GCM10010973_10420 [Cribrihabitans marinus]SEJ15566.1 Ion channel [Cribrihabitans marinus]